MSKKVLYHSIATASIMVSALSMSQYALADSISNAFNSGKVDLSIRARYETVDDGVNKNADASTLRTRLGFTSGHYKDFKTHIDFEVINIGGDFNSSTNGKADYAKVVDPKGEELNQVWLSYAGFDGTDLKIGRQRLILDNARFVGNVGWRQNEQTFDAYKIVNKDFDDIELTLAHISQVNTINSGDVSSSHNIMNAAFDKTALGKITAYGYLLDNDNSTADSNTFGVRLKGSTDSLLYTTEFAKQTDGADSTTNFSTTYLFAEVGYKLDDTKLFLGYESLGSDSGVAAFQTPLATKHAFNGWADKFLGGTPDNGLNNAYITVVSKLAGLKIVGTYHDFKADKGSDSYGSEIDLLLVKPFSKSVKGIVKYANYKADTLSSDTQKIWLSLEGNFKQ